MVSSMVSKCVHGLCYQLHALVLLQSTKYQVCKVVLTKLKLQGFKMGGTI